MNNDLMPDWLNPPQQLPDWMTSSSMPSRSLSSASSASSVVPFRKTLGPLTPKELREQRYQSVFDETLDRIANGSPLTIALQDNVFLEHAPINAASYLRWIRADNIRQDRYDEAWLIRGELLQEKMLMKSEGLNEDGTFSMTDVQRDQLFVTTAKWFLGIWNKKKFGDRKAIDIESTSTVTHISALSDAALSERLQQLTGQRVIIEGESERVE